MHSNYFVFSYWSISNYIFFALKSKSSCILSFTFKHFTPISMFQFHLVSCFAFSAFFHIVFRNFSHFLLFPFSPLLFLPIKGWYVSAFCPLVVTKWGSSTPHWVITGQHAAKAHSRTRTRTKSWTLFSLTPCIYSADLATGSLLCHCLHEPTHKHEQWYSHTHTDILSLSLWSTNIHRHFPFPLASITQHTLYQLPPLLSPPISQTKVSCPGLWLLM